MKTGWGLKLLGDVCIVNKRKHNGSAKPYVGMEDIESGTGRHLGAQSPLAVKSLTFAFTPEHVLYGRLRPYLNKVLLPDFYGHCSTEIFPLQPTPALDKGFLYHWITQATVVAAIDATCTGARMPRADVNDILKFEIPLPPLDEQRRTVAVLDKAFAGIAAATANAQKNLINARALFEGYLESTLNKKGDGWKDMTLGKACKVERGSSPRPIKSFVTTEDDGQNWIKIGDTKNDTKYVTQTKQRITPAGALKSRKVDPGDFILTNSMSFGKPYIIKISGYIHDGWFALRLGEGIDTEFFYYLLSSPIVQRQFRHLAAGAIVLNISGGLVKKAILPMPPLEQQRDIVSRIQLVDNETNRLAGIYEAKLAALTELKQSLLRQAFAGELT